MILFSSVYVNPCLFYIRCLFQISLTGSCYTTIAVTIERFLAIRLPFFIQKHNVKARHFIIPVFLYAVIYNISRFFEYRIDYFSCHQFINGTMTSKEFNEAMNITCENPYSIAHTDIRKSSLYISVSSFTGPQTKYNSSHFCNCH